MKPWARWQPSGSPRRCWRPCFPEGSALVSRRYPSRRPRHNGWIRTNGAGSLSRLLCFGPPTGGQGQKVHTLKRLGILVFGSMLLAATVVAGPVLAAGAATATPSITHGSFAGAAHDGQASSGKPLDVAALSGPSAAHDATAGSGTLAIFQQASQGSLDITVTPVGAVSGTPPTSLGPNDFTYGLVPAATYTITASQGATIFATGPVTVGVGQYVTALVYLSAGGPMITGFVNNQAPVALNHSRIVVRNTADIGPVDVDINQVPVTPSGLANNPSAPVKSDPVSQAAGSITISVSLASNPSVPLFPAVTGVVLPGNLLNVFVVGGGSGGFPLGLLTNSNPLGTGYRLYAGDGGVFDFNNASFFGSMDSPGAPHLNQPIVGASPTSLGLGYWLVASDGGIFSFGDAGFYGSAGNIPLNKPVVGMASTPDSGGYWLAASDGGIFRYGDAQFYGSLGATQLNKPIVGIAATPDGKGYWMVGSDGGVFTFGDAGYFGSTGNIALNKPIVAIVPTVDGQGYWLVASDGGVFTFGDAGYFGSTGNIALNKPIVSAISTPDSLGYWLVASDGGIFTFGDAGFYGSTGNIRLNSPIVAGSATGASVSN